MTEKIRLREKIKQAQGRGLLTGAGQGARAAMSVCDKSKRGHGFLWRWSGGGALVCKIHVSSTLKPCLERSEMDGRCSTWELLFSHTVSSSLWANPSSLPWCLDTSSCLPSQHCLSTVTDRYGSCSEPLLRKIPPPSHHRGVSPLDPRGPGEKRQIGTFVTVSFD
jgi:hypothetical protein